MSHYVPYNLKYFEKKLNEYEGKAYASGAPSDVVHEAQMLLKELVDLKDQGYDQSYNAFVERLNIVERLTNFIKSNHAEIIRPNKIPEKKIVFNDEQIPLTRYLLTLEKYSVDEESIKSQQNSLNPLMIDVLNYSKNIFENLKPNTAVIFLLRDALLPYFAFKYWAQQRGVHLTLKPWLMGRKWLGLFPNELIAGEDAQTQSQYFGSNDDLYEAMYHSIYSALDKNDTDFEDFVKNFKEYMSEDLKAFPKVCKTLKDLLGDIKEEHILVVESGRIASIPMLLKAIDDRVDFCLFTTIPEFYGVYNGKYFTNEYDKNRLFETLDCQHSLFQISGFENGEFLVKQTADNAVLGNAKRELVQWRQLLTR